MENSSKLDCVIHGCRTEFRVRDRTRILAQAKDCCVLTQERLRECGAVREVSMLNLRELGMRDADLLAPNRRHTSDSGVLECVAKCVSADHSSRANDYDAPLARRRYVRHSVRSSIQST